jgi:CspA family cold shock protein
VAAANLAICGKRPIFFGVMPRAGVRAGRSAGRDGMPTGTVKWFNTTKGYGFIAPDDGGKDVFVHISAVERAGLTGLADNQKVAFEMIEGRDGRKSAGDLKPL